MGASDQPKQWNVNGVPQELVSTVHSASEESVQGMINHLIKCGVPIHRLKSRWNTWKGAYWTPPDDEPPWTQEELIQIMDILETHPNVIALDFSAGDGSQG